MKKTGKIKISSCVRVVAIVVVLSLPFVTSFDQNPSSVIVRASPNQQHNSISKRIRIESKALYGQQKQQQQQQQQQTSIDKKMDTTYFDYTSSFVFSRSPLLSTTVNRIKGRSYISSRTFPIDITMTFNNNDEEELETQDRVDEYLEFLERRYNRLHDDEYDVSNTVSVTEPARNTVPWIESQMMKQPTSTVASSATSNDHELKRKAKSNSKVMKGNNQSPTNDTDGVVSRDRYFSSSTEPFENILYVLGVAGLASQRLLQKHSRSSAQHKYHPMTRMNQQNPQSIDRVSSKQQRVLDHAMQTKMDDVKIETDSSEQTGDRVVKGPLKILFSNIHALYLKSFIHQYYLLQYKKRQIKTMTASMMVVNFRRDRNKLQHDKFVAMTTKLTRTLWIAGGGKRNTLWTLNVMATFILYCVVANNISVTGD